jgi:hypothetical protein
VYNALQNVSLVSPKTILFHFGLIQVRFIPMLIIANNSGWEIIQHYNDKITAWGIEWFKDAKKSHKIRLNVLVYFSFVAGALSPGRTGLLARLIPFVFRSC